MKTIIYWILAIIITLSAAVYQRTTGPTYEKKYDVVYNDTDYHIELLRSHSTSKPAPVLINIVNKELTGNVYYRRYPSNDDFTKIQLVSVTNGLEGVLPNQPPAGKLEYYVELFNPNSNESFFDSDHIIIRYKGDVPATVLTPHIFFMFFAMLLSNLTGLLAFGKRQRFKFWGIVTLIFLALGGMVLGPIVQKYAFGELWTGVPFGWDLTDNKTLVAFIFWIIAVVGNWRKDRPVLSIIAAIVMLIVFSIPHSAFGSELDYSTGTIGQG
jgi:hypothetical protein